MNTELIFVFIVILIASILSVAMAYLTITERDMLTASIYLALLGVFYALIFYVLMAPDVVLAYVPVSSIILPALMILILGKVKKRFEDE